MKIYQNLQTRYYQFLQLSYYPCAVYMFWWLGVDDNFWIFSLSSICFSHCFLTHKVTFPNCVHLIVCHLSSGHWNWSNNWLFFHGESRCYDIPSLEVIAQVYQVQHSVASTFCFFLTQCTPICQNTVWHCSDEILFFFTGLIDCFRRNNI